MGLTQQQEGKMATLTKAQQNRKSAIIIGITILITAVVLLVALLPGKLEERALIKDGTPIAASPSGSYEEVRVKTGRYARHTEYVIQYEYEVGGKRYTVQGETKYRLSTFATKAIESQGEVVVHYEPGNPNHAIVVSGENEKE
jgi:hypothetical protein